MSLIDPLQKIAVRWHSNLEFVLLEEVEHYLSTFTLEDILHRITVRTQLDSLSMDTIYFIEAVSIIGTEEISFINSSRELGNITESSIH